MTLRPAFVLTLLLPVASACAENVAPASPVRYVSVVANLEVTVANGSTTVFKGYTDEKGRFETTTLEPGDYTFQLRIPKVITMPVRYTLALSGARPVGDARVGPGVAVAMNAQVRRPGSVRGHVNALRAISPATGATAGNIANSTSTATGGAVANPAMATPPRNGTSSATTTTSLPSQPARGATVAPSANATGAVRSGISPATAVTSPHPAHAPVASAPAPSTRAATAVSTGGRPATRPGATPPPSGIGTSTQSQLARTTGGSTTANTAQVATSAPKVYGPAATAKVNGPAGTRTAAPPLPNGAANPRTPTSTSSPAARATPSPTTVVDFRHLEPRPANYQPRTVNGRRYIWIQLAGTNMGQWIPDNADTQPAAPARSSAPATPARPPNPRPTPRRN